MVSHNARRWLAATAVVSASLTGPAMAHPARHKPAPDPRDKRIEALEQQVGQLSEIVKQMREERASAAANPAPIVAPAPAPAPVNPTPTFAQAPTAPSNAGATILAGKPSIQSGDGRFVANLHGVMQFDAAGYFQRAAGPLTVDFRRNTTGAPGSPTPSADFGRARDLNSGTNFRRARIGIDGKIFGDIDYNVLFEFGGAGVEDAGHIQELWLQYSGLKPFKVKIGAYPPSIGLEDQGSTNGSLFLERPAVADTARGIAGGDFREAVQLQAVGKRYLASVALTTRTVGVANVTSAQSAQTFDQAFGGIARFAFLPVVGDDYMAHVGVHGSRVFSIADANGPDGTPTARYLARLQERPELRVDGTRLIDTGNISARHVNSVGAELAVQKKQFMLQGEYEYFTVERRDSPLANPHFSGWYVEGGWVITGERRKYNASNFAFDAPTIDHPFDLGHGSFGALELAARYSVLDLNYREGAFGTAKAANGIRGGKQTIFTAGLNWYWNPIVRFMLDYSRVDINRLSPDTTAFNLAGYYAPLGAQIGQKYDVVSFRSQLAF